MRSNIKDARAKHKLQFTAGEDTTEVTQEIALKLHSRNITATLKEQAPDLGIDEGNVSMGKNKHAKRPAHADRPFLESNVDNSQWAQSARRRSTINRTSRVDA